MRLGRAFYFAVFVLVMTIFTRGCSAVSLAQTSVDTPWRYVSESNVWIRYLVGQQGTAILTLEKHGSKLRYGVALTCPTVKRRLIFTWEQGETYGKSRAGCDDKPLTVVAQDWEEVFEPLPDEVLGPPPAEIFINPEQWPPPIIV